MLQYFRKSEDHTKAGYFGFPALSHMEKIGLINFGSTGLGLPDVNEHVRISYNSIPVDLIIGEKLGNRLNFGVAAFTQEGMQLYRITDVAASKRALQSGADYFVDQKYSVSIPIEAKEDYLALKDS